MPSVSLGHAFGWQAGRSVTGAVRVREWSGDLVVQPWRPGHYRTDIVGSGPAPTITYRYGGTDDGGGDSPFGTGSWLDVSMPAWTSAAPKGARLFKAFRGPAFGVVFPTNNNLPSDQIEEFTVGVDGEYVLVNVVDGWARSRYTTTSLIVLDGSTMAAVFDDLDDGWHVGEVVFHSEASGTRAMRLNGWLGSKRAGYTEATRAGMPHRASLSTTAILIPTGPSGTQEQRVVHALWFKNNDASNARTVIIENVAETKDVMRIPLAQKGSDGDSYVLPIHGGAGFYADWRVKTGEAGSDSGGTTYVDMTVFAGD